MSIKLNSPGMEQAEQKDKIGNTEVNLIREVGYKLWFFTEKVKDNCDVKMNVEHMERVFKPICIAYTFQLEKGASGFLHFQGSIHLLKRLRFQQVKKLLSVECHWEKTNNYAAASAYCCKDETRQGGPWVWTLTSVVVREFTAEDLGILDFTQLYNWQKEIVKLVESEPVERKIYWYWEETGNIGKTALVRYLVYHHDAVFIQGKKSDIMQAINGKDGKTAIKRCYILGFSRSNESFISYDAIESIKDGLIFSSKYESGMRMFPVPHVIIFCNFAPDKSKLSADRWDITELQM